MAGRVRGAGTPEECWASAVGFWHCGDEMAGIRIPLGVLGAGMFGFVWELMLLLSSRGRRRFSRIWHTSICRSIVNTFLLLESLDSVDSGFFFFVFVFSEFVRDKEAVPRTISSWAAPTFQGETLQHGHRSASLGSRHRKRIRRAQMTSSLGMSRDLGARGVETRHDGSNQGSYVSPSPIPNLLSSKDSSRCQNSLQHQFTEKVP